MATRSAVINVMAKAADKAARALKRDFGEVSQLHVSMKGPGDFVSTADHKSERTIREELSKARPNFGLLMEESGAIPGSDPDHTWIVDPLDGTTNFLHGVPHFSISIALQAKGEIVAGLVFDPIRDETFWAEKGIGAYCNDRRMRVSGGKQLTESLLFTGIPFIETCSCETSPKSRFRARAALSAALAITLMTAERVAMGLYLNLWRVRRRSRRRC